MGLTEKEVEVLRLKRKGFTQIQIAKRLKISQPAVSFFYRNAMNKIRDSYETVKLAKKLKVKDE
jgi:Tfx family DNA-binding protein